MDEITLRELCATLDVTRRAVQGYEKAGLVRASGRSKRGYLLYDEEAREKIRRIKFYQQLGFRVREIKWLFEAPAPEVKAALEIQVEQLKKKRKEIGGLIAQTYELIDTL